MRVDGLMAAYWPHSAPEQRQPPLLIAYRLFLTVLRLVLDGDENQQRVLVRELKTVLYRYWEPLIVPQHP